MRILIHDYAGHPFPIQLSRELGRRGHTVRHVHCSSFQTPKGELTRRADDPPRLTIHPVVLAMPVLKDSFVRRRSQEVEVGRIVAEKVRDFSPDVVVSANAPLDAQKLIFQASKRLGARFVYWLQDLYAVAMARLLPRRLPAIGATIAKRYQLLERELLRGSDHVVAITDDFVPALWAHGVADNRISIIENWAPLEDMAPQSRNNAWANSRMAPDGLRAVYSGTLGMKHDHRMLMTLASGLRGHLHVYSEGRYANLLSREAAKAGIANLTVDGWVPFADLPAMLSGADVLVAMISEDAGTFSVPSKVLSYLCVGRPILAAIPSGNLARRILEREGAGIAVDPDDLDGLTLAVDRLSTDAGLWHRLAERGRAYAVHAFNIGRIGDRFEQVIRPPSVGGALKASSRSMSLELR